MTNIMGFQETYFEVLEIQETNSTAEIDTYSYGYGGEQ